MYSNAFQAGSALESGGLFWCEFNTIDIWHRRALGNEGWQAGLGGCPLICSEERLAGWHQWQFFEVMATKREEHVAE